MPGMPDADVTTSARSASTAAAWPLRAPPPLVALRPLDQRDPSRVAGEEA
jgi:hypothetical protein